MIPKILTYVTGEKYEQISTQESTSNLVENCIYTDNKHVHIYIPGWHIYRSVTQQIHKYLYMKCIIRKPALQVYFWTASRGSEQTAQLEGWSCDHDLCSPSSGITPQNKCRLWSDEAHVQVDHCLFWYKISVL